MFGVFGARRFIKAEKRILYLRKGKGVIMQGSGDKMKIALLTKRETEVLIRLAKGMTNQEIADFLDITERTVKNHLYSIYRKLGVFDRTQAALFAVRNGIAE